MIVDIKNFISLKTIFISLKVGKYIRYSEGLLEIKL